MSIKKQHIDALLASNEAWAQRLQAENPDIFDKLANQQSPRYLWIGCSDSRIPANEVLGLLPGEVFVHRNVGNIVHSLDINCHSVIQYAVEHLQVSDIIVSGHYDCGAIKAALSGQDFGLMNHWLSSLKNLYHYYQSGLARMSEERLHDHLCELNVIQQVRNVCKSTPVQRAWAAGQELYVHGMVFNVKTGRLHDLKVSVDSHDILDDIFKLNLEDLEE